MLSCNNIRFALNIMKFIIIIQGRHKYFESIIIILKIGPLIKR